MQDQDHARHHMNACKGEEEDPNGQKKKQLTWRIMTD